jgi:hypothetical protein
MAKLLYKNGVASVILRVFLQDTSVATGAGKTGLTSSSAGLIISTIADNEASPTTYTAAGSTIETIATLGTFAAPTSTKCRFKEVDATNFPGVYEMQIADARWAVSSARSLIVSIQATGVAQRYAEVQLAAIDVQDAVRFGLTALPNAAAEAAGGLYTRGTGAGQINQPANGMVDANVVRNAGTAITAAAGVQEVKVQSYATGQAPLQPATAGRTLVVDAAGLADANAVKVGPSGSGTAQTARDLGGQLDAAVSTRMATFTLPTNFSSLVIDSTGRVNAFLIGILTSVFTEGATGRIAAAFKQFFNIASPAATMDHGILVDTATTVTNAVTAGTVSDKTGYALTSAYDPAKTAAQAGDAMALTSGERTTLTAAIWNALTSGLTTVASIGKLLVDNINATISSRSTYDGSDTSGTTTLLGRLTSTRAGNLDNLDATVSSRATTSGVAAQVTTDHGAGSYIRNTEPLDAAGTRSAVGLASANLDTQLALIASYIDSEVATLVTNVATILTRLGVPSSDIATLIAAIKAKTDNLPASPAATGDAMTLTSGERDSIAAALLDLANGVETGVTTRQSLRVMLAALAGKVSGADANAPVFRDVNDTKPRITATTDSSGNRSVVTVDAT